MKLLAFVALAIVVSPFVLIASAVAPMWEAA